MNIRPYYYNAAWQRIETVMRETGHPTLEGFARSIGYDRPLNIRYIRFHQRGIRPDIAFAINRTYPQYSIQWLLAGEEICTDPESKYRFPVEGSPVVYLPFYPDMDFWLSVDTPPADYLIVSKGLTNLASFASLYTSDIYFPKVRPGNFVLMRECEPQRLLYNHFYYIITPSMRGYRIVRSTANKDEVLLGTLRPDKYQELRVQKDSISHSFLLCGSINHTLLD